MQLKLILLLTIILKISSMTQYKLNQNKSISASNEFFFPIYISCLIKSTSNITSQLQIKTIKGNAYVNNQAIENGLIYNISKKTKFLGIYINSFSEISIKNEGPGNFSAYCGLDLTKKKNTIDNTKQIKNESLNKRIIGLKSNQSINVTNRFFFTIYSYCYVESFNSTSEIFAKMDIGEGYINGLFVANGVSFKIAKKEFFQMAIRPFSKISISNKGPGNISAFCGIESQLKKIEFFKQLKNKIESIF